MNILVVSPHPDDETLGAGGTILKYRQEGHKIFWLNCSNMDISYGYPSDVVNKRLKEIELVKGRFVFDGYCDLHLKPSKLDSYPRHDLISMIDDVFNRWKPEELLVPYQFDAHSDHRVIFDALVPFFKSFRYPFIKKVMMMEILSETDNFGSSFGFMPNYFVNISDYIEQKIDIMKLYEGEIKDPPFPRSEENIRALSRYRGATVGVDYAEAFMILKEVR